jgi:hypothetical protein
MLAPPPADIDFPIRPQALDAEPRLRLGLLNRGDLRAASTAARKGSASADCTSSCIARMSSCVRPVRVPSICAIRIDRNGDAQSRVMVFGQRRSISLLAVTICPDGGSRMTGSD